LIIDAFYQGILTGKLDQRQRQLQVMKSMGRDLRPHQLDETMQALASWSVSTTRLLGSLDAKIASLQESIQLNNQAQEEHNQKIEQLRKDIRANTNLKKMDVTVREGGDESKKKGYNNGDYASPDYNNERVKKRYDIRKVGSYYFLY
jgi:COP9 signalosome complex subunit 7